MAVVEIDERCFTFTWMLENASYCLEKKDEIIESPAFVVDEIQKTTWRLKLYPRGEDDYGNYIGCYLCREFDSKGEESVKIKYELSFIGKKGLDLTSKELILYNFLKDESYGHPDIAKREDVFILRRSKFLPKDTLAVRCKIWKTIGCMTENVRCFARTRIGVEKRSFVWNLKSFSTLEPGKECSYLIKSLSSDEELMSVNLCLIGGQNCEEMINFKLTREDETIKYSAFKLYVVDVNGKRIGCNQDEFWFQKLSDDQRFTFLFSRQMLMAKKMLYLPSDVLSLQWEIVFSKGVVSEEIEEVQCGCIVPQLKFLTLASE